MHTTDSPRISPRLAVTDPTALPTAKSTSPWRVPVRETVSSGRVVARDTMVAPMMNRGTPVASAIHTAPSKNQSPPLMIRSRPSRNNSTVIQISIQSTAFQKFSETSIPRGNAGNRQLSHGIKVSLFSGPGWRLAIVMTSRATFKT